MVEDLYGKYLEKVSEGITYGETVKSLLNNQEFQRKMHTWWAVNGLSDRDLQRLVRSKYRNDVQDRFVALTSQGVSLEDISYERPIGLY